MCICKYEEHLARQERTWTKHFKIPEVDRLGYGLFAREKFSKKTHIGEYAGELPPIAPHQPKSSNLHIQTRTLSPSLGRESETKVKTKKRKKIAGCQTQHINPRNAMDCIQTMR
ncbi:hypothetical protein BCR34DRAFT_594926 [Clohesyomyces aquaticus]|uniref:Uncharacterized protein n=1 Tax=Clohesyomyces aquaticus TaxID=1231657 RepID=A0A1Y1Y2N5_9PLEO|nr:hypothetical protein BCR34DRAFT_594926 [Clohesyomyces aquaticus]